VTFVCIILATSKASCKDLNGADPALLMNRIRRTIDDAEVSRYNHEGLDEEKLAKKVAESLLTDKQQTLETPQDLNNGRLKRSTHSGYVRFGKRLSPSIEEGHYNADSLDYDDVGGADDSEESFVQRQQRAPKSSFVRFGKRAPDGLSYSGCVAYTLARARNRSDLLRMLVENGCVKDKRLLHYAKKDGYIRFGK